MAAGWLSLISGCEAEDAPWLFAFFDAATAGACDDFFAVEVEPLRFGNETELFRFFLASLTARKIGGVSISMLQLSFHLFLTYYKTPRSSDFS